MSTSEGQHRWDGLEKKTRDARLRWFVHVRRKDDENIRRRMLRMELPGKTKRGRFLLLRDTTLLHKIEDLVSAPNLKLGCAVILRGCASDYK